MEITSWSNATPTLSVKELEEYLSSIFASKGRTPLVFQASPEYALAAAHSVNDKKLIDLLTSLPPNTDWVEVNIK